MWPVGQFCSVFLAHMCTCWCSAYKLLPFPLRSKDFCDMEQRMAHSTAPSQLVAGIPKRLDLLLSHNSLCKWLLQLKLHSPPPPPQLFLYWLLIDWYSRSTKCHQFPLTEKYVNSASLLPLQLPGACPVQKQTFSMPCSCRCRFLGFFTIQC